jgi:hypothetical protein
LIAHLRQAAWTKAVDQQGGVPPIGKALRPLAIVRLEIYYEMPHALQLFAHGRTDQDETPGQQRR